MVYLRHEYNDDDIWKTRVAPLKYTSVARLELVACECLTKLLVYIIEAFEPIGVKIQSVHGWTDSEIALAWIRKPSSTWKTFVSNRVQTIHDRFPASIWRHCPVEDNPADKLTRGLTLKELKDYQLYWEGPKWFRQSPEFWPIQTKRMDTKEELRNTVKTKAKAMVDTKEPKSILDELGTRFEKFKTVVRVISWIFRWI